MHSRQNSYQDGNSPTDVDQSLDLVWTWYCITKSSCAIYIDIYIYWGFFVTYGGWMHGWCKMRTYEKQLRRLDGARTTWIAIGTRSVQDWGPHPRHQSKNLEMKYKTHIKLVHESYGTYFQYNPIQCEESRIKRLTLLLGVTLPFACWFLWRAYFIEDFKWRPHFKFEVAFRRVVLRGVYFEGPKRIRRARKTSILNTSHKEVLCDRINECVHIKIVATI